MKNLIFLLTVLVLFLFSCGEKPQNIKTVSITPNLDIYTSPQGFGEYMYNTLFLQNLCDDVISFKLEKILFPKTKFENDLQSTIQKNNLKSFDVDCYDIYLKNYRKIDSLVSENSQNADELKKFIYITATIKRDFFLLKALNRDSLEKKYMVLYDKFDSIRIQFEPIAQEYELHNADNSQNFKTEN